MALRAAVADEGEQAVFLVVGERGQVTGGVSVDARLRPAERALERGDRLADVDEHLRDRPAIGRAHPVEGRVAGHPVRREAHCVRERRQDAEQGLVLRRVEVVDGVGDEEPRKSELVRVLQRPERLRPQRVSAAVPNCQRE